MTLNVKAFTLTVGIIWAGAVLTVGLTNLIWNDYGVAFLQVVASIYPGYEGSPTAGNLVIATLYALVDGGFGGLVFAAIYNMFAGRFGSGDSSVASASA